LYTPIKEKPGVQPEDSDIDPLDTAVNINRVREPVNFFQKYKTKLEKNRRETSLRKKLMPSIFENKLNNSTNRLINNIIQSKKEPSNVKIASKPKKIFPKYFDEANKKLAMDYVRRLIPGSSGLTELKIEILTKLIINGLNTSKKISKFDLKYSPDFVKLDTANPRKYFFMVLDWNMSCVFA
jgi:hypothetical protein